jgi:hypothetical protein
MSDREEARAMLHVAARDVAAVFTHVQGSLD